MAVYSLLIAVIFNVGIINGIEDYCLTNLLDTEGNYMEFTKEPSRSESAIAGNFKGLHCCAKGYISIEWYKDGIPYPWYGDVSPLIIYPQSLNQTIYTQTVNMDDAGNYTCLMRNQSMVYAHSIILNVYERLPEDPQITHISDDTEVDLGKPVRLFCEAFVGVIDLPDAYNDAEWTGPNNTEHFRDKSRITQIKVSREKGQTVGSYLIIKYLKTEDYGRYACKITKPGKTIELYRHIRQPIKILYINPNPVPYRNLLIGSAVVVLLLITALLLNLQYGLFLRVKLKDRFGRVPEREEKINDVLVLYSEKDSELTLGVLLPTLETKYNYKCGSRQLPQDINTWYSDLAEAFTKSLQIVVVISPSTVGENWECSVLYSALKQLYELDPQFCCVTLKPFPTNGNQVKNSHGASFSSLIRNINVVYWERSKDEKFWLSLRLQLPPKRCSQINLSVDPKSLNHNASDMSV